MEDLLALLVVAAASVAVIFLTIRFYRVMKQRRLAEKAEYDRKVKAAEKYWAERAGKAREIAAKKEVPPVVQKVREQATPKKKKEETQSSSSSSDNGFDLIDGLLVANALVDVARAFNHSNSSSSSSSDFGLDDSDSRKSISDSFSSSWSSSDSSSSSDSGPSSDW